MKRSYRYNSDRVTCSLPVRRLWQSTRRLCEGAEEIECVGKIPLG